MSTHPEIAKALRYLADRCDYANEKDGAGFSASDTRFGHEMAALVADDCALSADEHLRVMEFLPKYHRQLDGAGINLPSLPALHQYFADHAKEMERSRSEYEGRRKQVEEAAKQEALKQLRVEFDANLSELAVCDLAETHPAIAATVCFLANANSFMTDLFIRMKGGRNLSPKQQTAAWKSLDANQDDLRSLGVQIISDTELKDWLQAIEDAKPQKPLGEVRLLGETLVITFEYNPRFVAQLKELIGDAGLSPGRCWNQAGKFWQVPLSMAGALTRVFPEFEFDAAIEQAAQEEVENARAESLLKAQAVQDMVGMLKLDEPMKNGWSLFPYQKEVIARSIATIETTPLRGPILAMPMGSGKTLMGLHVGKAYQQLHGDTVFVVCPATLKDNWLREAEYVGVNIEVFSWAKIPTPLEYGRYIVIADEVHYSQGGTKTKRGKSFLELSQHPNCRAVLPMSGTPMKNGRPINLMPILQAISHPLVNDPRAYQVRYCDAKRTRWCPWDVTGAAHLDELSQKISDALIRYSKKEILKDLPEKTLVMRPAEVAGERLQAWKDAIADAKLEYENMQEEMNTAAALVLMGKLRKAASHAKVDTAVELANEILEQGESVVLFTEFLESAKELHSIFGGELLTGETPVADRQAMVDRFQSGESKVFVSTSRAGGVGITLTASSTVIMVDRPWTPGDADQCADRCHRIGQTSNVLVLWLQWSEIDQKVDGILAQKSERIELVLQGKRKTLRGIKHPNDIAKELLESVLGIKTKKLAAV